MKNRDKIPLTSSAAPVVPYQWDPYRGCLVAPDHVLTGHFRDFMNLATRCLQSKEQRKAFNKQIIFMLRSLRLSSHNEVINADAGVLHVLTMSQLYELSVVADSALASTIQENSAESTKCLKLVALLKCLSDLIALLWFRFNPAGSVTYPEWRAHYIEQVKVRTRVYLAQLHDLCTSPPPTDGSSPTNIHVLARGHVDKPNVHRLQELAFTTVAMFGEVSNFGELSLQKAHQVHKRNIRKSNNIRVHLSSMRHVAFDDWQGRLALLSRRHPLISRRDCRAYVNLLYGPRFCGHLQRDEVNRMTPRVFETMTGHACIAQELRSQNKYAICPRPWKFPATWDSTFQTHADHVWEESDKQRAIERLLEKCADERDSLAIRREQCISALDAERETVFTIRPGIFVTASSTDPRNVESKFYFTRGILTAVHSDGEKDGFLRVSLCDEVSRTLAGRAVLSMAASQDGALIPLSRLVALASVIPLLLRCDNVPAENTTRQPVRSSSSFLAFSAAEGFLPRRG